MGRPFPTPWVKGRAGVSSLGDMEVILGNHIIFLIDTLNSVCADVSLSLPIPSDKPRAVVLESGLEMFFYRLGLVLDSLVFGFGLVSDLVIRLAKCSSWSRLVQQYMLFFLSFKTKPLIWLVCSANG